MCVNSLVFLEEILGLPPVREIEFTIELMPGTTPISNKIGGIKVAVARIVEEWFY